MSLILNIDTATETAHVSIADNGIILQEAFNKEQKDHAGFLQPAIRELLLKENILFKTIDAIAVTTGPGSYTGLRVGMGSAKGLAYALKKPLIGIGTLEAMAMAAIMQLPGSSGNSILFCPMIDARRMEVFTALYDLQLNTLLEPCAMILDENSFLPFMNNSIVNFFGSGINKWESLCHHKNGFFQQILSISQSMAKLSAEKLSKNDFIDTIHASPLYIKEFNIKFP